MAKRIIVFSCVAASYFCVLLPFYRELVPTWLAAILASAVFSVTLLAADILAKGQPWRAFWIANAALTLCFGGLGIVGGLLQRPGDSATGLGGQLLLIDGRITVAGVESLALSIGICVLSNLVGFFAARGLIARLD